MKNSLKIAAAGVLSAISIVLLALGSILWIFSYTTPLFCGLIMIIIIESFGKKTALCVYACVSVLSLILLPDKESALLYVMLTGYYPIIADKIDKIKYSFFRIMLKLLLFNATVIEAELICTYVFGIPFDNFMGKWGIIILLLLANVVLFIYDRLLKIITVIYVKKYKNRLEKFLK